MKRFLALAALSLLAFHLPAATSRDVLRAFRNPTDAYRPYVRWWWNGDKVDEAVDVTGKVKGNKLRLRIPPGNWQVYYMVRYESFASVINGAPGAAGQILDHMNAAAVRKYLDRMSDRIEARLGPLSNHLRAFFVDSMELEGANWTGDFAEQFKLRRGYDIMPWLPFTMFKLRRLGEVEDFNYGCAKGARFQEQVNRARYDFELTKAELLEERFFKVYEQWARDHGVKSRAQGYGCGFFPLETSLGCIR